MKRDFRPFAPVGLYLSMLAALAAAGLYFVQREWNLYLQISLGLVLIGLALFAILDPERVRQALTGRQARYGSNALVLSLAFFGILAVINYLVYENSKRWDLTEDQQNTLAKETIDTLKSLPVAVEAQAFFTARMNTQQASGLLEQYKFNSNGMFDYRFIDPEADPLAAQAAEISRDGTVVLRMGDRQEQVAFVSEQELTGSLVRLMSQDSLGVYFLTAHGERDPNGSGDVAYAKVKRALEGKNYKVDQLNLLATRLIPEDARVIVVAGPVKPLSEEEIGLLNDFSTAGGSLILMEEPLPLTDFGDAEDPLASYLAQTWGINWGVDIIVDLTSQQPFIAYANRYGTHAITEKMMGLGSYFPTARSVQTGSVPQGISITELIFTADQAWAETDLLAIQDQTKQINPDQGVDLIGNVPLAIVAENSQTSQRVVVFGDSDFATDANFDNFGNGDLLINSVDWAAEQENLINLTPKEPIQRVLIAPQTITLNLILLGSIFLVPGLVLLSGGLVWFQRRKRG